MDRFVGGLTILPSPDRLPKQADPEQSGDYQDLPAMTFVTHVRHRLTALVHDRTSLWLLTTGVVLNLGQWVSILTLLPKREQLAPLHYSIYFGLDLIGPWQQLLWLPGLGSFVILFHAIGSATVDDHVWRRAWVLMAIMLEIVFGLAIAALWYNAWRFQ